ncbi:MAG: type II toxin-antitoxin system HicA family toxin [Alphaproteobacteria bacterium]|nr:type II toxin-antitoxin system HicA family toxin [Alphaproteobacteria bacterium]
MVKFFLDRGFRKKPQKKGSHTILTKNGIVRPLVIPNYKELDIRIIRNNLKTAGISEEEFIAAMQGKKKT